MGEEAPGFLTPIYTWIDTNLGSSGLAVLMLLLMVYRVSSNVTRLRTMWIPGTTLILLMSNPFKNRGTLLF